jgi:hypothetical protein
MTGKYMSAEKKVLNYFLIIFFGAAVLLAGTTWWHKARSCESHCVAKGSSAGKLSLSGGGRFNMSMVCRCIAAGDSK